MAFRGTDYEKLGAFYLGRPVQPETGAKLSQPLLYDSKDLTTHAVILGMTGSGKTGLGVSLLEEAAIDGIPAIAIDPKGDLGNLALQFPKLEAQDFEPWVDPKEAMRKGFSVRDFAAETARRWKEGLGDDAQPPERIQRLAESAQVKVYTPGSQAGIPLTVLKSFRVPPVQVLEDADALRDALHGSTAGLLALLGIDPDPVRSREFVLISKILEHCWLRGSDVDLTRLIQLVQRPPFETLGVMDLEAIYPASDRLGLAMALNNVLASPGFQAWMQGVPLDVERLLFSEDGVPQLSVLSIAHLSDEERMFFLTILLSEVLHWMRGQSGTASLRALLYMDEVFGYLPPTASPPTKRLLLTLLKQARAFGLGLVLSTQNPVDLDYKSLSNAGTWFLGRLQTERDQKRVLDGLEGIGDTGFDRSEVEGLLNGMQSRVFLMKNVHEEGLALFHTRWCLSYLRGPLTRNEIQTLTAEDSSPTEELERGRNVDQSFLAQAPSRQTQAAPVERPAVPPEVSEFFLPSEPSHTPGARLVYRPALLGKAELHYVRARQGLDTWSRKVLLAPIPSQVNGRTWEKAESLEVERLELLDEPEGDAEFTKLPSSAKKESSYKTWSKALKNYLYREEPLVLFLCKELKLTSEAGETLAQFKSRLRQEAREARDLEVEKLRRRYAPKLARLQEKIRVAEERVEKEEEQYEHARNSSLIRVGETVLGALFGRKSSRGLFSKASTTMRTWSRTSKESSDIDRAKDRVEDLTQELEELEAEFQAETKALEAETGIDSYEIEELPVAPRKGDLEIRRLALVWTPWWETEDGDREPAYV